jgi:hypothetical protein
VLERLEEGEILKTPFSGNNPQIPIFQGWVEKMRQRIQTLNLDTLTPLEALLFLNELKKWLAESSHQD